MNGFFDALGIVIMLAFIFTMTFGAWVIGIYTIFSWVLS